MAMLIGYNKLVRLDGNGQTLDMLSIVPINTVADPEGGLDSPPPFGPEIFFFKWS